MTSHPKSLEEKLAGLPSSPGVYVFRGAAGAVLYIGKARQLRSRVRSYFRPGTGDSRAFIARLESEVEDLETFVVPTEKDAALLENQLIKEHQPRYNVKLRDDKDFLSLRLDPDVRWPRLEVVRRPKADTAHYFGPYPSATSARQTLRLVNRHFQLRTCTDAEFKKRVRPCLQYQIKRCPAPCVRDVDREEYMEQVRNVRLFLESRHDELVRVLEKSMQEASQQLHFERAAVLRDQIRAVERAREKQHVSVVADLDQDVLGLHRENGEAQIAMLLLREGKLVDVRTFELEPSELPDEELVSSFLGALYGDAAVPPDEVLLPCAIEAMEGLADVLSERRGRRVRVIVPKRGARRKLLDLAADNARHAFFERRASQRATEMRLEEARKALRLETPPRLLECIDISHTGGEDVVAAIVRFRDGEPDRIRYRSFHIRKARGGDDYGAMHEALSRRFRRARAQEAQWDPPDLLVVDGGKGQLRAALTALSDLGVLGVEVVALAKERVTASGEELADRVYLPGQKNPLNLRATHPAIRLLAGARDEAHRVSNTYRVRRGKKRALRSDLDSVPGVGPTTRARLLKALGSVRAVRKASEEELLRAGITRRQARAIKRSFAGS